MKSPLLHPVTKRYADRSTAKGFAFSFYCDQCGKEWRSTPQAFRTGNMEPPTDLRIVRMMWNGRHKAAYEKANLEAICSFYYCPTCRRRVCLECYSKSETDVAEICIKCLAKENTPSDREDLTDKKNKPFWSLHSFHNRRARM